MEGDKPKKKFLAYPIGYFHIDIAEVRTEEGKLYLFVAIDRTCKFAFAELQRKPRHRFADFLRALIEAVPYEIHTVLTDNGLQFSTPARVNRPAIKRPAPQPVLRHMFDRACASTASSIA